MTKEGSAQNPTELDQAVTVFLTESTHGYLKSKRTVSGFKWLSATPNSGLSQKQGWKIHVSAAPDEALLLFRLIRDCFYTEPMPFKVLLSRNDIARLNSGGGGEEQIGKVATIYPRDDNNCASILGFIEPRWQSRRGPIVLTDLLISPFKRVSLRYGAFVTRRIPSNSLGQQLLAVEDPSGKLVPDERSILGKPPEWAPAPPVLCHQPQLLPKFPILIEEEAHYLAAPLHVSPKSSVFLGTTTPALLPTIVKITRRGLAPDRSGADACDRLAREWNILRSLDGIGPEPVVFQRVECGEFAILITRDLQAIPICDLDRQAFGHKVGKAAKTLKELHARGFIHGDIKSKNVLYSNLTDAVYLIDFELARPIGAKEQDHLQGTPGYIAPDIQIRERVSAASDIYSFGVLVAHGALGVDPALLQIQPGALAALLKAEGYSALAQELRLLMHPNADKRPSAAELAASMKPTLFVRGLPWVNRSGIIKWAKRASADTGALTAEFLLENHKKRDDLGLDVIGDDINSGIAGIGVGLVVLQYCLGTKTWQSEIRQIVERLARHKVQNGYGFFCGSAGIAAALGLFSIKFADRDLGVKALSIIDECARKAGHMDLFFGHAGILFAAVLLRAATGNEDAINIVAHSAATLIESPTVTGGVLGWHQSFSKGSAEVYVGASHGAAGIAMALSLWGRAAGTPLGLQACKIAEQAFRSLYAHCVVANKPAFKVSENGAESTGRDVNWCHGTGGVLWSLLNAEISSEALADARGQMAYRFLQGEQANGSAFCHGLAGQLELACMLRNERAHALSARLLSYRLARILNIISFKQDGRATWHADRSGGFSPALWIGSLGPAVSLAMWHRRINAALFSPSFFQTLAQGGHKSDELL